MKSQQTQVVDTIDGQQRATLEDAQDVADFHWFHGFMPREEIKELLCQPGDFILRQTELKNDQGFQLVLSVRAESKVAHFPVWKTVDAASGKRFHIQPPRTFPSVTRLVMCYHQSGEEISELTHARCKNPIRRQTWELRRDDIAVKELLGEGAYGAVHRGTLRVGKTVIHVAVKLHKVEALNKEKLNEFIHEARLLRDYSHPNIVKFHGVSYDKQPVLLCMELAPDGSLDKYLRKNRHLPTVSPKDRLQMCIDAARGLAYLHGRSPCVIHRDVAARNCLVAHRRVKISDFGLATRLANQYANSTDNTVDKNMPIRWMAPEALATNVFSANSDVYSFGVLMWEIYTDAVAAPYKETKQLQDVFDGVRKGTLSIERPEQMPTKIGRIMTAGCLVRDPTKRWTMEKARQKLEKMMKKLFDKDPTGSEHSRRPSSQQPTTRDPTSKTKKPSKYGGGSSKSTPKSIIGGSPC